MDPPLEVDQEVEHVENDNQSDCKELVPDFRPVLVEHLFEKDRVIERYFR